MFAIGERSSAISLSLVYNVCSRSTVCQPRSWSRHALMTTITDCQYFGRNHQAKRTGSPAQQKNDAKGRGQHQDFINPSLSASQLTNVFSDTLRSRSSKRKGPSVGENPVAKHARAFYLVEQGEMEFQGRSSDRTFLRGLKEEIGAWPGDDTPRNLPTAFSVPGLFITERGSRCGVALPPIHRATKLVQAALDAHILLNFVHRPSFNRLFHLVYSLEPGEYSSKERQFLPLLYALLAYGTLFSQQIEDTSYGEILSEASQYYAKSKQLQDIAECKSLISLQAIVILNLFLLSTTRLSTCYTYLTTSMSIALRMGLHQSLDKSQDVISQEIGKRLFWVLRFLINDVAAGIGLPNLLDGNDIGQLLPMQDHDTDSPDNIILDQFNDLISHLSGFSTYQSLHLIFDKVIKQLYPSKTSSGSKISDSTSQTVAFSTVRELESELMQWAKKLPLSLRLGATTTRNPVQRAHYMLYLTYAHTQLCLYRPFLHYMSSISLQSECSVSSAPLCAIACIDAAQNIVALCLDMFKHGLLAGPNWIAIHILFSSMSCLLYSILMSRATYHAEMIFKDISKSRKILNFLAKTSFHARRAKITFTVMVSNIPSNFAAIRDRLFEFDVETSNDLNHDSPDDSPRLSEESYTASLARKTLSVSSKFLFHEPPPGIQSSTDRGNGGHDMQDGSSLVPQTHQRKLVALHAPSTLPFPVVRSPSEHSHQTGSKTTEETRTLGNTFLVNSENAEKFLEARSLSLEHGPTFVNWLEQAELDSSKSLTLCDGYSNMSQDWGDSPCIASYF
ncbi:Activator of stress protein [Trichoderma lentiforme]|uniref:Activator of stress protein n=1 Tax=Trichoderma lentiforme TaxID=1567552 RepID=A0A9P5C7Z3_9HYPO|nr:Activator of stress protein [Trichoderma lentiforme]